jgi:GNAT superfamily N-acetyltransferase
MGGPDDLSVKYTVDKPLVSSAPAHFRARPITKQDFDHIVQVVDQWWEGPIAGLVHPIFFYELGKWARVVEDTSHDDRLVGFLFGFTVAADGDRPAGGYIHLVGIDPEYRRKGVARALYAEFTSLCLSEGCKRVKAITTVGNLGSVRFHEALGWQVREEPDYAGPGRKRLVCTREL